MIHIHMEGIKGGGGGRVGVGHEDDSSDGMQCIDHPYRNNNPGGICAFCLQEKLGKLVSSSFPLPIRPSTSSSSSPSFRSDIASSSTSTTRPYASSSSTITVTATTSTAAIASSSSSSSLPISICPTKKTGNDASNHYHEYHSRRTRLPFLLAKKKKKKPSGSDIILKRSKSTATPRRGHSLVDADDEDFSPRKRNGFWSFLSLSSKSSASGNKKLNSKSFIRAGNNNNNVHSTPTPRISTINNAATSNGLTAAATAKLKEKCCSGSSKSTDIVVIEEDNSPNSQTASSFERKVSRSRSVGCGSRSFSGDFFERISTGFGDCTLRRVESQREGKHKVTSATAGGSGGAVNRGADHHHHHHHCMKERVRCAGLFSGFMMTSSSSSSSSSSYWVSSSADDAAVHGKPVSHSGRGKNWGWAFASPMRAFSSKTASKENTNRRDIIRDANDKNATPNLSAMPSLLSARA